MKRVAAFVDAGYFWVQLCKLVIGSYDSRAQVVVDYPALREATLAEIASQLPDADLLRVYWYDGPGTGGKTPEHYAIDRLDDFKLRLGTRNGEGKQKGVDGMIIADLISLTQQKAITHAILMSGDADMAPGVVAAQGMGLRIHLLSLGSSAATSPYLAAEVDLKRTWGIEQAQRFAANAAPAATASLPDAAQPATPQTAPVKPMAAIAQDALVQIRSGANAAVFAGLRAGQFTLPREIDGELLSVGRAQLGRALNESEKRELRNHLRAAIV